MRSCGHPCARKVSRISVHLVHLSVVHRPFRAPLWGSRNVGLSATNDKAVAIGAKPRPITSINHHNPERPSESGETDGERRNARPPVASLVWRRNFRFCTPQLGAK